MVYEARGERLEAELEAKRRALRDAMECLSDDSHLTKQGLAAQEMLRDMLLEMLGEMAEIGRNLEALRQEARE
jgi:hypothetical protein